MSRRAQENLFAAVLLAVLAGAIGLAAGYGPRARMVPLPVAALGLVLLVAQLVWQNRRSTGELRVDLLEVLVQADRAGLAPGGGAAPGGPAVQASARVSEAAAFGIVAALLALTLALGPIPAAALFTFGYFAASRRYSWTRNLIYTLSFAAALYLLFVAALDVQLYHGLLEPAVETLRQWRAAARSVLR